MSTTRRKRAAIIGAIGITLSAAIWAYSVLSKSKTNPNEPPKKKSRTGPRIPLTLSTSILPPIDIFKLLLETHILHLLLPSKERFQLSSEYQSLLELMGGKLLFHETGEGIVHMARVIGGIFVSVEQKMEGNKVGDEIERISNERLVKELSRFIGTSVLIVSDQQDKNSMLKEVGEESRSLKIVIGWDGLIQLLQL